MRVALVIPSLGGGHLQGCLEAVAKLDPPPATTVLVATGIDRAPSAPGAVSIVRPHRLGFAAAVNLGMQSVDGEIDAVALLNDDAVPAAGWLGSLAAALESDAGLGAVQGTVTDRTGHGIDGRGIAFDRWALPIQLDRGRELAGERGTAPLCAVSGTACLYRRRALDESALSGGRVFDERFDSYLEDLDLGLRLLRLGWRSQWVGGAGARHLGSTTGAAFRWRHPWWLLANRWRALAGNLSAAALLRALPRLLRGELRAVRTLARTNPRAGPVSIAVLTSLPILVLGGWRRATPGRRLAALPSAVP